VPALPPIPPEPTESHIDFWPSPALLLIAIGLLLFWRRGQRDRVPHQA
jgi:hypothetical protein